MTDEDRELLDHAFAVQDNAHAPFSKYPVGAAVRTEDGAIFTGCNVESASFSLTCCAERVAVFKAVSEGHTRVMSCAIVTIEDEPALPCGACRQVLWEFGGDVRIVLGNGKGKTRTLQLEDILPGGFTGAQLPGRSEKLD